MVNGLEQAALVALANLNNGGKVGQPNPNPNPNPVSSGTAQCIIDSHFPIY